MISLLIGYREQFMQILNIMEKKRERVNRGIVNTILEALRHINRILGWPDPDAFPAHWAGANPPGNNGGAQTTRSPRTPESAFDELVQLVGGNQATAERLIRFERIRLPNAGRLELIERAIERLLRDRQ
jgi:hypothetical protein